MRSESGIDAGYFEMVVRGVQQHQSDIDRAFRIIDLAADAGEVPVGAVITVENKVVAVGHNEREGREDPAEATPRPGFVPRRLDVR